MFPRLMLRPMAALFSQVVCCRFLALRNVARLKAHPSEASACGCLRSLIGFQLALVLLAAALFIYTACGSVSDP
jgi:hypothetical protein